jgi:hypothetical protein
MMIICVVDHNTCVCVCVCGGGGHLMSETVTHHRTESIRSRRGVDGEVWKHLKTLADSTSVVVGTNLAKPRQ